MKSAIQRRLDHEYRTLSVAIAQDLRTLRHGVEDAIAALARGDRMDQQLFANSVLLTVQIAHWNLVRDLMPMVEDAAVAKPRSRR